MKNKTPKRLRLEDFTYPKNNEEFLALGQRLGEELALQAASRSTFWQAPWRPPNWKEWSKRNPDFVLPYVHVKGHPAQPVGGDCKL
jgi:hypothetical protein